MGIFYVYFCLILYFCKFFSAISIETLGDSIGYFAQVVFYMSKIWVGMIVIGAIFFAYSAGLASFNDIIMEIMKSFLFYWIFEIFQFCSWLLIFLGSYGIFD